MWQIFKNNFLLKVISLGLALAGWGYFRFEANPVGAGRATQQLSIPITAVHLPLGYLAHYAEKEAVVTVSPPKPGGAAIRPDEVKAVLDLDGLHAGVYNVAIRLVTPNVAVRSLSPASVTLTIAHMEQKEFKIGVYYSGSEPRAIVTSDAKTVPSLALARGGSDDLARIAAVRVDVPLPNAPQLFDAMVRPVAVDSLGAEVQGVQVSPNLVRVRARFVTGAKR